MREGAEDKRGGVLYKLSISHEYYFRVYIVAIVATPLHLAWHCGKQALSPPLFVNVARVHISPQTPLQFSVLVKGLTMPRLCVHHHNHKCISDTSCGDSCIFVYMACTTVE